jgi:serine/threonine protein kinase
MHHTLSHAATTPPAYPDDDAADEPRRRDVERLLSADALPMSDRLRAEARGTAERLFAASKHAPLRPGDRLGAYRVGRLLGLGGQAFVYEATHEALGRRVALKVPRPEVAERVLQEARLTASLEHPNVVRVEDVSSEGAELPFLVMELCSGGSLDQLLERYPRGLPVPEVRRIATAVLEALSWAHARGVVHRDVKPANVLFDGQGTPKLADLGIGTQATAAVDLVHSVSLTNQTDGPAGTPLYVAPEQEDPRRLAGAAVDGRADLFSFGKMLFVLLTGASPRTIRPPSRLRAELSPAWDDLVFRLVEEDRARRHASAGEVLAALRAIPDGRSAAAPAPRAPAPPLPPLRALPVPVPASPALPTLGAVAPPSPPTVPPAVIVRSRRAERHGRRAARLLSLAGLFSLGFWVWLVAFRHWGAGPWLGLSLVKTGALTGGLALLWLARVGRRPDVVGPPLPVAFGLAALLAGWAPYVALHGEGLYSRGLLPTAGAGVLFSFLLALVARLTLFRRAPTEAQPEVEVRVRPRERPSEPQIVVHRRTPFGEALQAVATVIGWSVAAVAVVALGLIVGLVVLGVFASWRTKLAAWPDRRRCSWTSWTRSSWTRSTPCTSTSASRGRRSCATSTRARGSSSRPARSRSRPWPPASSRTDGRSTCRRSRPGCAGATGGWRGSRRSSTTCAPPGSSSTRSRTTRPGRRSSTRRCACRTGCPGPSARGGPGSGSPTRAPSSTP